MKVHQIGEVLVEKMINGVYKIIGLAGGVPEGHDIVAAKWPDTAINRDTKSDYWQCFGYSEHVAWMDVDIDLSRGENSFGIIRAPNLDRVRAALALTTLTTIDPDDI